MMETCFSCGYSFFTREHNRDICLRCESEANRRAFGPQIAQDRQERDMDYWDEEEPMP